LINLVQSLPGLITKEAEATQHKHTTPRRSSSIDLADPGLPATALLNNLSLLADSHSDDPPYTAPPPRSPFSEASSSSPPSPRPPPFSSLYFPPELELRRFKTTVTEASCASIAAFAPAPPFEETAPLNPSSAASAAVAETKAALPQDTKGESSGKGVDDGEPPPPYTEGSSPLDSFTYVMAAAGGAASIITQVQQTGGPPINSLGGALLFFSVLEALIDDLHCGIMC
jgi:dipeptidyl-peptidase-3